MNANVLQKVMEQLADQRARNEREEVAPPSRGVGQMPRNRPGDGCAPRGGDEKRVLSLCHSGG